MDRTWPMLRPLPPLELTDAVNLKTFSIADIFNAYHMTIVEFGSGSLYKQLGYTFLKLPRLNRTFGGRVGYLFIYTAEAFPDEDWPAHLSKDEKNAAAIKFQNSIENPTGICIDNEEGSIHSLAGSMPNAVWVINDKGAPVYWAAWEDMFNLENWMTQEFRMRLAATKNPLSRAVQVEVNQINTALHPIDIAARIKSVD